MMNHRKINENLHKINYPSPLTAISPSSSLRTSVPSQSLLPDALSPDYPYAPYLELVLSLSCLPSFCQIGLILPFAGRSNVKITIAQVPSVSQQQISEEAFQIYGCVINPFLRILIIRSHQRITEIPRMIGKHYCSPQNQ